MLSQKRLIEDLSKSSPQEIEMKTMKEQIIIMKDRDPRVNILSDK